MSMSDTGISCKCGFLHPFFFSEKREVQLMRHFYYIVALLGDLITIYECNTLL